MIKKDMEKLNGRDDWLAKEIVRESKVSAWDFDEGHKLKTEHEEDCEREEMAVKHHVRHEMREKVTDENFSKPKGKFSYWYVIDIFAVVILTFVNIGMGMDNFFPSLILFLLLNPGIFIWLFVFRRYPPRWYLILALIIAVVIEILSIQSHYGFIRLFHRLGRF